MGSSITALNSRRRFRRNFGSIAEVAKMPNLIDVQRSSYDLFLQRDVEPSKRESIGLQEVFQSVFPISDFNDKSILEFVSYTLEEPKYDVEECQQRGLNFASSLKVTLRLVVWEEDEITGTRSLRDTKEQEVYMGDMPLMTKNGTFIINGTERVIVSQMHRSPGVFFDHDRGKSHASGKLLFSARVIPYRGSWLDFEFDAKDIINVRIDRKRKLPATTFLMALIDEASEAYVAECKKEGIDPDRTKVNGLSREAILNHFYESVDYKRSKKGWQTDFDASRLRGARLSHDLINAGNGEVVAAKGEKLTPRSLRKLEESGIKEVLVGDEQIVGQYIAHDIIDMTTGLVLTEAGDIVTEEILQSLQEMKTDKIRLLAIDNVNIGSFLRNTLAADRNNSREDALVDIYRVMRPGEPPTLETAEALFNGLFFDSERYDLSSVGRVKLNARVGLDVDDQMRVLRRDDILGIIKVLVDLRDGKGEIDDIDHLGNRRVRSVGELMENQYRIGLVRMERAIKERMSSVEIDRTMPTDLINSKPAAAAVKEFFGSSQLSQFMDQTNPLSEITHKRRLSALGPGGLTRERAGFEVRDVHPTHYGRICPIETPEGPNIGLINSLATFAKINRYGFIETPYRKVENGKVTDEVIYISAMDEGRFAIAQANAELDDKGRFVGELIPIRRAGEIGLGNPQEIDLMDVSPKQLVSVAASLIPFLENDDANRALMGSNMQRQAVPLIKSEAPLVGTGMEAIVAKDSGVTIIARRSGVVDQVDATRIVVRSNETSEQDVSPVDIYSLLKFQRSNQNTCITQRPLVRVGDEVLAGDILADGPSTEDGELALGRNVLVAFMPWNGYNFEDSILISERIVRDDVFTSIHIEEYEIMARDTKLGTEEITRDIPNVGEEALKNLDEAGMIYVGADVQAGDILVGKVTPKGETPMTPEEKLLRAIFGEKASDVRDTSLRVPPGGAGTVVEVRVFSRRGVDKDERSRAIERFEIERLSKDRDDEREILERGFYNRLLELMVGQTVASGPAGIKKDSKITNDMLTELARNRWNEIAVKDDKVQKSIEAQIDDFEKSIKKLEARFNDKVDKLQRGDELLPGVMKMVKVFVAVKRKLQPGDKMAGRHGNKGVISRILPVEDMPYLDDGTPVDIVLNPLGVPSRMNVGQILETHLGWASSGLGKKIARVVDEAVQKNSPKLIKDELKQIYSPEQFKESIDKLDDQQLVEQGRLLSKGVPMATPVFDGAKEKDVRNFLTYAGLNETGQEWLTDGRTGETFDRSVTVGYIYMLKLHHLVDEKIHARSIGPYSLVTQQPLGGKAQFGGQRFGEMEVWALEAYGAAYTLQEMLTVKSDDVTGRTKVYESIIRGDDDFEAGIPESFNVLVKELQSLGLDVDLQSSEY
ncbi:MAG: DNA-directed RNA polymerase subunit beta [Alphaproteobacteria bacterium]|jgi:DNA-directed RNA polymerase subunit beta|nr:DNA-directed RNA polymerase subunit beta [Alphaproteobacteria bacterium]